LGPNWHNLRGNRPDQFHMARKGDVGPYHPDNVKCITARMNRIEGGSKNRGEASGKVAKLTERQVLAIRKAHGLQRDIAKRFGISRTAVCLIKRRQRWQHVP